MLVVTSNQCPQSLLDRAKGHKTIQLLNQQSPLTHHMKGHQHCHLVLKTSLALHRLQGFAEILKLFLIPTNNKTKILQIQHVFLRACKGLNTKEPWKASIQPHEKNGLPERVPVTSTVLPVVTSKGRSLGYHGPSTTHGWCCTHFTRSSTDSFC